MARITARVPSTGKPITLVGTAGNGLANGTWLTIAEAPDFSVPDPQQQFPVRDPLDAARAIRAGEVFILRPLLLHHIASQQDDRVYRLRLLRENGTAFDLFCESVPSSSTVSIPLQGLSLFKRDPTSANGDRLQIATSINVFWRWWGAAEERLAPDHLGVV